jgi:Ca2+-binding RTX toxin-like protein
MVNLSAVAFNHWTIGVDTIQPNGTSSADVLTGSNRDDAFAAGDGNDILTGGGGNDALDGGPGIDIAVYSGLHTQYLVKASLNGLQAQVADLRPGSPDGSDTLTGFERLQFADRVEDTGQFAGRIEPLERKQLF